VATEGVYPVIGTGAVGIHVNVDPGILELRLTVEKVLPEHIVCAWIALTEGKGFTITTT